MKGVMDLRAFKGLRYDLDEIGLALSLNDPGQEALGRARKAVSRILDFLKDVPNPALGVYSDCNIIDRYFFSRKLKPTTLFDDIRTGVWLLESARTAERHLRDYLEGLEKAWTICALAPDQADLIAAQKLAQ